MEYVLYFEMVVLVGLSVTLFIQTKRFARELNNKVANLKKSAWV